MQAGDIKLGKVFATDHQHVIPLFQRPYVWIEERNWLPLWTDIRKSAEDVEAERAAPDNDLGSKGDSYDNALAESVIGLYKSELITMRGPWRTVDDVELGTLTWVDWWNHRRLLWPIGGMPPAEFEAEWLDQAENQPLRVSAAVGT